MTTRQAQRQTPSPGGLLRGKMASAGLVRIMATHSPLSARLAEEAGFDGLWASGFELSALYGLADVSLIGMTQHLDMVRAIAEQSRLPLVAQPTVKTRPHLPLGLGEREHTRVRPVGEASATS